MAARNKMSQVDHQKDLFKKLVTNESFNKEAAALKAIFGNSIWWLSENEEKIFSLGGAKIKCPVWLKVGPGRANCEKRLRHLINKAKGIKKPVHFNCGKNKFGTCFPVVQGDRIYGYVLMCNSKTEISDTIIPLFSNFVDTLTRELQKELELAKLYKTIRPRAIALSTIHTIHRIISSTLNLDELLPKLARLCLQVFRAKKCCIILKNHYRKLQVISATSKNEKMKSRTADRALVQLLNKERVLTKGRMLINRHRLCVPLTGEDIIGAICIINKTSEAPFDEFDKEILMTLSEQAVVAIENAQLYNEQENITIGSIKSLATILNTGTPGTYRVKESFIKIVLAMGRKLGLRIEDLRAIHYGAILHDAGQIAFPDELLVKTDKLTGEEYNIIKRHPSKSVSIIKHLGFMKPVIPIILHHHENFDGSGYPKGLKGEEIPLGARIMAVASAFNAMVTKRPYRQKVDVKSAVAEIRKNAGAQFDPHVVDVFLEVIQDKEISNLLTRGL